MSLALGLMASRGARAEPDAGVAPDAGAPLVLVPNASAAASEKSSVPEGHPAPPALDSTRSPMPDRLANDHWMQYFPMAAPTPPVPSASGSGAHRVNTIKKVGTGGAPPDIPRGSVTRTPEDLMAPTGPSSTP